MENFSSLRRDQKEAIGLLQIGTFLEYFDLMLYVHMAVLLNELFFPKTDPHTASILAGLAFCSTYALRPFGALLFGYIGDHLGRKTTVIITTLMMSVSCIIMANLSTYAQVGISAAWFVTLCRMLQGLSSLGEIIGAEIYLTEITKPPVRYPVVALIAVCSILGSMTALLVASLVTTSGSSWRIAFWIGAGIALIGSIVRTRLRETPDFLDMKKRMKKVTESVGEVGLSVAMEVLERTRTTWKEKLNPKTLSAYFLIQSGWPVCFYFTYIHCGTILKNSFGYTALQVIHHNLGVSVIQLISFLVLTYLSYSIHPLKLLKAKLYLFLPFVLIFPYMLSIAPSPAILLVIQAVCATVGPTMNPAPSVFLSHLPVFRRFTCTSIIFAVSHTLMYAATPFLLVYATDFFAQWGILVIMLPITLAFWWGMNHFEMLEKARGMMGITKHTPTAVAQTDAA